MTFDISSLCTGATSGVATDQIGSLSARDLRMQIFQTPSNTQYAPQKQGSSATYIASKVPYQCARGCRMQV